MADVDQLFDEFVARYHRGEAPRVRAYVHRAGADGPELDAMLSAFVATVAPPAPSDSAIADAAEELGFSSRIKLSDAARGLVGVVDFQPGPVISSDAQTGADLETLEEAAAAYRQIGDFQGELAMLKATGEALHTQGRLSEALAAVDQGVEVAGTSGTDEALLGMLTESASLLSAIGRPNEALQRYEHALVLSREIGDRPQEVALGREVVRCLRDLGREAEAERVTAAFSKPEQRQVGGQPTRQSIGAFLKERVQVPAQQILERAQELLEPAGALQVAMVSQRSVSVDDQRVTISLKAQAGQWFGIGRAEIDRVTGTMRLHLKDVIPELRGTRPYLIFPLVKSSDSPRVTWSGAAEGLVDGVVRTPEPIGESHGDTQVEVGTLEVPTADARALVGNFFLASDLEVMGDMRVPYTED